MARVIPPRMRVARTRLLCGITFALSLVRGDSPVLRHAFMHASDVQRMHTNCSEKTLQEFARTTTEKKTLSRDLQSKIASHEFEKPPIRAHPQNVAVQEKWDLFFTSHNGKVHFLLGETQRTGLSKVIHIVKVIRENLSQAEQVTNLGFLITIISVMSRVLNRTFCLTANQVRRCRKKW